MWSVVQTVSAAVVDKILTVEEELESPCTVSRSVLLKDKLNGRPWGKNDLILEGN